MQPLFQASLLHQMHTIKLNMSYKSYSSTYYRRIDTICTRLVARILVRVSVNMSSLCRAQLDAFIYTRSREAHSQKVRLQVYLHCEYHSFMTVQVPDTQHVAPVHELPPHCAH